jgi:hypothetical protein
MAIDAVALTITASLTIGTMEITNRTSPCMNCALENVTNRIG